MQIQNQTTATDPTQAASSAATKDSSQSAASNVAGLANESTFLQLLVAQLKNQDPLQPTDSMQFLGQLAQFSQLEQLIGIRQELGTTTPASGTTADPTTKPTTN